MWARRRTGTLGVVSAMILGMLVQTAVVYPAAAQRPGPSAILKQVIGRVEIVRAGQTQWSPVVAGARVVEGDGIRVFAGATAELLLPDKSVVVIAENSRIVMSKLDIDPEKQTRLVLLHLAWGKVRANIEPAGLGLARASQSDFAITTPTAIAAAKGTIVWVYYDLLKSWMAVEPDPGRRSPSRIECIGLTGTERRRQMVLEGTATTDCGPPVLYSSEFLNFANPFTAGANLGANVVALSTTNALAAIAGGQTGGAQSTFGTSSQPTGLPGPASVGINQEVFCSTDPCNP